MGADQHRAEPSPQQAAPDRGAGGFPGRGQLPLGQHDDANEIPSAELWKTRVARALALVREVRALWRGWLDSVDTLFAQLQDHSLRASWKTRSVRRCRTSSRALRSSRF